jgi:hypothetical protein
MAVKFHDCGLSVPGTGVPDNSSTMMETTPLQNVWQMQVTGQYGYRRYRIPSPIVKTELEIFQH